MKMSEDTIRNLIMNAPIDVFSSGGFEQATMRLIAEKAQVPTTTIYKYFQNKDGLFVTIISIIIDRTTSELNMHLAGISSTKSKISRMLSFQLEFLESNPKIGYLLFASASTSYWYKHKKALKKLRESSAVLTRIISEGQQKNEIRTDIDSHVVKHMLFGALRTMVVSWLYSKRTYRLSDMSDYFADAIYGAIMSKTAPPPFICPLMETPAKPKKNKLR
jgi:AcrR family transcriptional regulator